MKGEHYGTKMLERMWLPLTLMAHDCEEMNVWLMSMEYSLTWVRIFLVSISSSRKGQLPFRGFFFHLFNSIAAIQFGSLVWQHFILEKGWKRRRYYTAKKSCEVWGYYTQTGLAILEFCGNFPAVGPVPAQTLNYYGLCRGEGKKKKLFHRVPLRFLTPQLEHKEAGGQAEGG